MTFTEKWNYAHAELARTRRRINHAKTNAEACARYETRVLIFEGFVTALRTELVPVYRRPHG